MKTLHFLPLIAALALNSCVDPVAPPPQFKPIPPNPPVPTNPNFDPNQGGYNQPQPNYPTTPPPPSSPSASRSPGQYPVAQRTNNPLEVISPYPPNHVINIEGYRSGELVRDPSNKQIFRVP